ncbi:MAG: anion permease [Planctomycetales bacterium]|nr:anion permease [Planctomycetales bacterium]
MIIILALIVALLAYANGANDNFKGVATIFGGGAASFKRAIGWATICTLAGSICAVTLAGTLLKNFSGKGLIEETLVAKAEFAACVSVGAGLTVLIATRFGLPISTTHGLLGALLGTGIAAGSEIDGSKLLSSFAAPLLFSPLLAIVATTLIYPVLRSVRLRLGVSSQSCTCIGTQVLQVVSACDAVCYDAAKERIEITHGHAASCRTAYSGVVMGIEAEKALNSLHFLSAGAVSFARGLNDTPKIAALLLVMPHISPSLALLLVGGTMAVGGLISGRRVAETMSHKITQMNHGQGFTANLVTALIVINAGRIGMPVSTTHVSCGTLFGMGAVNGTARWRTILSILGAWLITLPMGAVMGATSWSLVRVFYG